MQDDEDYKRRTSVVAELTRVYAAELATTAGKLEFTDQIDVLAGVFTMLTNSESLSRRLPRRVAFHNAQVFLQGRIALMEAYLPRDAGAS